MIGLKLGLGLLRDSSRPWYLGYKVDDTDPSLLLQFDKQRYAANSVAKSFSDILTFSRSTTATYFDSAGVMRTAAINAPRFDYNPATGEALGLLSEGQRTNLTLYSSGFSNSIWTKNNSGTGIPCEVNVLDVVSTQDLPDATQGSDTGKGFTITGLCYDAGRDCLWAGNFGITQSSGGASGTPQIIKLSNDGSTIIDEIGTSHKFQGLAYDNNDDVLYYAYPDNGDIYQINPDGSGETVIISGLTSINGLAYDENRDQIWYTSGTDIVRATKAGVVQQTVSSGISIIDHLYYHAEKDWLFVTSGSNDHQGIITVLKASDGAVVKTYTCDEAYAIEGITMVGGKIIVGNDGYYHNDAISLPERLKNQIQTYPFSYGIIADSLPDYIKIGTGGGLTGSDNSWVQQSIVSAATRVFSVYMKDAHGDTPILSLRLDDTTSNTNAQKILTDYWDRYSILRSAGGTTTQTVKIIARGDYGSSELCRFWVQAAQLESAEFPSSHIPTTSVAVTRTADVVSNSASNSVPFASWYNQAEFTVFADFLFYGGASSFPRIFEIGDGGSNANTTSLIQTTATNQAAFNIYTGSAYQGFGFGNPDLRATRNKFAGGVKLNNSAAGYNGAIGGTDNAILMPTGNIRLDIGNGPSGTQASFFHLRELRYYPIRASNSELQRITT